MSEKRYESIKRLMAVILFATLEAAAVVIVIVAVAQIATNH